MRRDPLADGRAWLVVTAAYLILTVLFLWPIVLPWTLTSMSQPADAILMSGIMGHTSRALFAGASRFWDFEIFYPLHNTLCYSEAMLTPAVLMAPFIWLLGVGGAHNLYLYLCWLSTALGTWAWLRNRGMGNLPAFWAGLCAAFSLDRLFHGFGHSHLVFHAGFPVVLLAVERALAPRSSRLWGFVFGVFFMAQVFAGFYMTALFCLWCAFMLPDAAWHAWRRQGPHAVLTGLRRQWPQLVGWPLLTACLMFPVASQYRRVTKDTPQHSLEFCQVFSADWAGYLLPPADPGRMVTVSGLLTLKSQGPVDRKENTQPVGNTGLMLVLVACGYAVLRMRPKQLGASVPCGSKDRLLLVLGAGLTALVLSLGPYGTSPGGDIWRLPFAWLYAWFEPLRFFRAPARFAFVVQWSVAVLGAYGLWWAQCSLRKRDEHRTALIIGVLALLLTGIEFFSLQRTALVSIRKTPFSSYLAEDRGKSPFVEVPSANPDMMARLQWHYTPLAGGINGYYPLNRNQELNYFDREFPSPAALTLLERWGIDRAFVTRFATLPQKHNAAENAGWRQIWKGDEGTFYEIPWKSGLFDRLLTEKRTAAGYPPGSQVPAIELLKSGKPAGVVPVWSSGMREERPEGPSRVPVRVYERPLALVEASFAERPLAPSVYTRLRLHLRVTNWYKLKEQGALYWDTSARPGYTDDRAVQFVVPADGEWHDIDVPLGELAAWTFENPVRRICLQLGGRVDNRLELETVSLESGPVNWLLPEARRNWHRVKF